MPPRFRRSLPIAGVAVLVTTALASADTPAGAAPRVRPETRETRELVAELAERSATVRCLIDRLNASDVVVYIRHRPFTDTTLDGRIGIVRSKGPSRILIVELPCGRSTVNQLVALGHELQHAVEIADAVHVVDAASLAEHYERIGRRTSAARDALTFETEAARGVSMEIRRELFAVPVRTAHERE